MASGGGLYWSPITLWPFNQPRKGRGATVGATGAWMPPGTVDSTDSNECYTGFFLDMKHVILLTPLGSRH